MKLILASHSYINATVGHMLPSDVPHSIKPCNVFLIGFGVVRRAWRNDPNRWTGSLDRAAHRPAVAMPAESYPRYSGRLSASMSEAPTGSRPRMPKIPHVRAASFADRAGYNADDDVSRPMPKGNQHRSQLVKLDT